jgi:hypothetical protein
LSRDLNYWSSKGLKGPKPYPIIGNFSDLLFKTFYQIEEERLQKYGKIYGFVSSIHLILLKTIIKFII